MSFSDALSVASLGLGSIAIAIAVGIYRRQTSQTNAQGRRASALANLELREKFGTISSRAERLEAIRHKTSADLGITKHLRPRKKEQILEWRAQIMYLLYDCLAVDEVYEHATLATQHEFKELMVGYNEIWKDVPMIHGDRAELRAANADNLLEFFTKRLRAYKADGKPPGLGTTSVEHPTKI
jgi:hypothetical protein